MLSAHALKCRVQSCVIERGGWGSPRVSCCLRSALSCDGERNLWTVDGGASEGSGKENSMWPLVECASRTGRTLRFVFAGES